MKTNFLFPNEFKKIGWVLFTPSFITMVIGLFLGFDYENILTLKVFALYNDSFIGKNCLFCFIKNGIFDEIISLFIILGGVLIGFSKLKYEDEYISKIRYESLVWATYFNFALILFFTLFFFGIIYLNVIFVNIFSSLVFFIVRFHYLIYKLKKENLNEE